MANLSSLRKFMDNFMQNLLQMGMSLSQARAQANIWLDNQMKEYAQSLENQKTMEEIRRVNTIEQSRMNAEEAEKARQSGFGVEVKKGLLNPKTTGFERDQLLDSIRTLLPESDISTLGLKFPQQKELSPQIPAMLERTYPGPGTATTLPAPRILPGAPWQTTPAPAPVSDLAGPGVSSYSSLLDQFDEWQKMPPDAKAVMIRSFGPDQIFKTIQERIKATQGEKSMKAEAGKLVTEAEQKEKQRKLTQDQLDLETKKFEREIAGGGGKLTDVDKERIKQIDEAQTFIVSQEAKWDKWDSLKPEIQFLHPELKPLSAELQGAVLQYSDGIKNDILSGKDIKPHQINFINIMKNAPALNKLGTLTSVLESFLTPPSTAQPSAVQAAPVVTAPQVSARDIYYNRLIENGVPPKDALNMTIAKFGK